MCFYTNIFLFKNLKRPITEIFYFCQFFFKPKTLLNHLHGKKKFPYHLYFDLSNADNHHFLKSDKTIFVQKELITYFSLKVLFFVFLSLDITHSHCITPRT